MYVYNILSEAIANLMDECFLYCLAVLLVATTEIPKQNYTTYTHTMQSSVFDTFCANSPFGLV